MADRVGDADLAAFLDLRAVDEAVWAGPVEPWVGPAPGGLLVGQAVMAVARSRPGRRPWSVQTVFTSPVTPGAACTFAVGLVHEGRHTTVGQVDVTQDGTRRALATVTLGDDGRPADAGPVRRAQPPSVAAPEACVDWEDVRRAAEGPRAARRPSPVEVRVDPDGSVDEHGVHRSHAWVRLRTPLPDDPLLHTGAVAFATDLTLLRSTVRPERSPFALRRALTLNHTVWFHREDRWTDWVLYATACPTAGHGRALATGVVVDRDGALVSGAQDGLVLW